MSRIYLDYNASAPMRPEAIEAMSRAFAAPGNPSSVHAAGRAARAMVEEARNAVAVAMTAILGGADVDASLAEAQSTVEFAQGI